MVTRNKLSHHKTQRVAIVTVLKNPGPLLRSYLAYHLAIGFDHIFLFFDDPNDPAIPEARQYRDVTVVLHDEALKRELRKTRTYENDEIRRFADLQVSARQSLMVDVAIGLALRERFDWLLHIDFDELFYSPTRSVKEHFQALADHRIDRILYVNHEVVPESADVWDPFRESTLFKKHTYTLAGKRITQEQQRLIDLCPQLPERFYYFYRSGKSAVRLREGVLPCGVHSFTVPEDRGWQARWNLKVFKSKPAMLAAKVAPGWVKGLADGLYPCRTGLSLDPVILHYPCCGFENFWRKYVNFGRFADTWMGKIDIAATLGPFTIESRDLVARGDRKLAKEFYTRRVVMSDPEQVARLINAGLLCRIEGPAMLLEKSTADRMSA